MFNWLKNWFKKSEISFKDAFYLTQLPIIIAEVDGKIMKFVLDSGSSCSYINKVDFLDVSLSDESYEIANVNGLDGINHQVIYCNTIIKIQGLSFVHKFGAYDLTATFKKFKEECGVELNGILGSDFFEANKYVLDFSKLTFYKK